ncbi:MAG: hypothetical protein HQM12_23905, partial [SAR324 cluster bacterium]|nr:hypothetical protein [SAR324 cluster bacterium]
MEPRNHLQVRPKWHFSSSHLFIHEAIDSTSIQKYIGHLGSPFLPTLSEIADSNPNDTKTKKALTFSHILPLEILLIDDTALIHSESHKLIDDTALIHSESHKGRKTSEEQTKTIEEYTHIRSIIRRIHQNKEYGWNSCEENDMGMVFKNEKTKQEIRIRTRGLQFAKDLLIEDPVAVQELKSAQWDVILLDINFGKSRHLQTLGKSLIPVIRRHQPLLPLYMLSDVQNTEMLYSTIRQGASWFFSKFPVNKQIQLPQQVQQQSDNQTKNLIQQIAQHLGHHGTNPEEKIPEFNFKNLLDRLHEHYWKDWEKEVEERKWNLNQGMVDRIEFWKKSEPKFEKEYRYLLKSLFEDFQEIFIEKAANQGLSSAKTFFVRPRKRERHLSGQEREVNYNVQL